jgi:hypothetical protein
VSVNTLAHRNNNLNQKRMADNYSQKNGIYPSISTTTVDPNIHDPDIRDPHDINKHLRVRKIKFDSKKI